MQLSVDKVINSNNLYKILKSTTIESGLKYGLAGGNWGIKSNNTKVGIAQVLNRLTYTSTLSHLRRVNTPTEKTGKLVARENFIILSGELFAQQKLQKVVPLGL